ncbi:MAG: DNA topoisomerase 3 [Myxococcota bacterium]|nr:DNA topoisomerase 3 [Myxococcota bacterium]
MTRTLIIAEKPSVAADIARVVGATNKETHAWEGEDHVVSWAVGHLLEFVPPEGYDDALKRWRLKDLPIMPEQFKLAPVKGNSRQLTAVKRYLKAKDIEKVVNACDAGREGELIFREIYRFSGSKKPVQRLWLQSMTDAGIRQSLETSRPADEFQGLADSADCRAESDWLIGMNATRALTVRLRSQRDRAVWSAGRVQTATLAMLVSREREILAHEPKAYWLISANFSVDGDGAHQYVGTWYDPKAEGRKDRIFDPERRDAILALLESNTQGSATETREDHKEAAPPLLDLTSLQREANRRHGFSARRTLSAAQALYEQHKVITYPRTDSRALPQDYRERVQGALQFLQGESNYSAHAKRLLDQGLSYEARNFDDSAVSDHFAIIPTGEGKPSQLKGDDLRIFDLIARRFLAAFHPPAIATQVERITTVGTELFRTRQKTLKEEGWRAVFDRGDRDPNTQLRPLAKAEGCQVGLGDHSSEEKQTKPPARLTEAALLGLMETGGKELEDAEALEVLRATGGLGTPATRAEIIETLLSRQYASRCTALSNRKALRATSRGIRLIDALKRIELPQLTSVELTAQFENSLRSIEKGEATRSDYMQDVRDRTADIVDKVRGFQFQTLYEGVDAVGGCPLCSASVFESLRTYSCQNNRQDGDCKFVIWKEVGGRYVDRNSATQLIQSEETPTKAGFFTRDNREYEASLARNPDGRIVVRSGKQSAEGEGAADVEPADVGPCPFHPDKLVRRSAQGYRCDAYADGECKLNLPLQVCQRALSVEEVAALTGAERQTSLLEGFTSKRNRPFSAILKLTDTARLEWQFPPRRNSEGKAVAAKEFEVNPDPLSACPRHPDAKIVETPTAFVCNDDSCNISIPREICQREVKRDEILELFTNKESAVLEGFISRAGKPFSASLYIKRTGRHGFRFGNRN